MVSALTRWDPPFLRVRGYQGFEEGRLTPHPAAGRLFKSSIDLRMVDTLWAWGSLRATAMLGSRQRSKESGFANVGLVDTASNRR
jgi:hypothetical protein